MTTVKEKITPMMQQWHACKKVAKEAILLFRMGDFYEAFYQDAEILSETLDLTLTKRQEIPMAGIPWHTCENYVERLVEKGLKVAIAEQTEDPKQTKGLVNREVVRFITPGTVVNPIGSAHNFIASLTQVGSLFGLAFLDLTTTTFQVIECENIQDLLNELYRLRPSEIITLDSFQKRHPLFFKELDHPVVSIVESWLFDHKIAYNYLTRHFNVHQLDGFGLKGMVAAINAAGGLLAYIHDHLTLPIAHIRSISPFSTKESLYLDRVSVRHLELTESMHGLSDKNTLMNVLDQTKTPMGKRLLKQWIKRPLVDVDQIQERLDGVETFYYAPELLSKLRQHLQPIRDLERLTMRIVSGYGTARDLVALALSLKEIDPIKKILDAEALISLSELCDLIGNSLVDEPPLRLTEGKLFQDGFHAELDELRELTRGGKRWLANYQAEIKEQTGIKNLKVSFNKVFGYYIEVSKGQAHLMPSSFQRRQTLVNAERFISPILKEYETKVLSAEEKIHRLEHTLFQELREKAASYEKTIFANAKALAQIDVLASLAIVAKRQGYCRPTIDTSDILNIEEGRHPVVEVAHKETFIPNDTQLKSTEHLMLITGPNMAGKSTYIRQVALIVIMAQMGSFVPCNKAHIGVVDKIFTRIGASDDLSRGQSTFMVEMSETANILHNVSSKSLVILDEIGRGTSTYDGVAIAWAVSEYLLTSRAKTLFATHYWELTELEQTFEGAINYHATVLEENESITFMHTITKGAANRSYGIHVARLAGLPLSVIGRAQTLLQKLEGKRSSKPPLRRPSRETQLTFL